LTDVEATHAAYVASKNEEEAKTKARIAELELEAAKVPALEKKLAEKTAEGEGLRTQAGSTGTELATVQARFADLDVEHKTLENRLQAKDAVIAEHEEAHSVKDAQLAGLTSKVAELGLAAGTLTTLALEHKELQGQLQAKDALIAEHEAAHSDKDARLATLTSRLAESEQAARRVAALEKKVDYHADANKEKDEHIEQLLSQVDDLKAETAHKDAQITYLDERVTELAPLAATVVELKAKLDEKESYVGALLSRVDELRPVIASHAELQQSLESTQYEHNLTARKLQMAETGLVAHQMEIAKLNDQLLQQKAQPAVKTMAAVAGAGVATAALVSHFYDVNEGKEAPPEVSEIEKHLEELNKAAAAKDVEIGALKAKIDQFETAPDPDAKRQILFTAKTAELTNLKVVVNTLLQPVNQDEIAQRAYFHAQSRGFNGGSPTEDWYRAERDVHYGRLAYAWESTRSGTMY